MANSNKLTFSTGVTALLAACIRGYSEDEDKDDPETDRSRNAIVHMLLQAGASLNILKTGKRDNPMHWACINGDVELVKVRD